LHPEVAEKYHKIMAQRFEWNPEEKRKKISSLDTEDSPIRKLGVKAGKEERPQKEL
jgi:hypothetical protein